ncbi:MAG: hypothetical protein IPL40_09650 [Proteobacteria bacterium]|nr:hypothetical protein [Pseudomonadota bacterium]
MSFVVADAQPFATATLAHIYRGQGRLLQARSVFERLLRERPDDAQALRGLEQVKTEIAAMLKQATGGDDTLLVEVCAEGLELRWVIAARGIERARLVLGTEGQLVARLVGFPFDPGLSVRDRRLDALSGSVVLIPPPGALVASAAVGIVAEDARFAAIAHAPVIPIKPQSIPRTGLRIKESPCSEEP